MPITGIGTHIKVKNIEASRKFYKALGFTSVFAYGPNEIVREAYSGIVFEHDGCKLEIADGHRAVKPAVFDERVESSKISLMISVDSLVEIIERAKAAEISIAVAPRHYYWNTLELVIKDPDGVVLVFIAPYSEAEAKRVSADETWSIQPKI